MVRSNGEARDPFATYVRMEPRLEALWELCRRAAPPARGEEGDDDVFAENTSERPDDGWCAEDYFHVHVKSKLLVLVGNLRPKGPQELQTCTAYDEVYDLLITWALPRSCACCAAPAGEPWRDVGDRSACW